MNCRCHLARNGDALVLHEHSLIKPLSLRNVVVGKGIARRFTIYYPSTMDRATRTPSVLTVSHMNVPNCVHLLSIRLLSDTRGFIYRVEINRTQVKRPIQHRCTWLYPRSWNA